jgi:hypothetical protein
MTRTTRTLALLLLAAPLLLAGCAAGRKHAPIAPAVPPAADSATVGLWHLDENGGTGAADSGPYRLDGTAGIDTRTDFGRFKTSRVFQNANDSFVYVPYNPVMDVAGPFTVEAWINLNATTLYELTVIAARWTPVPNTQSWVLGVSGYNEQYPLVPRNSPGWFTSVLGVAPAKHLIFGFVPSGAGTERGYVSTVELPLDHWVHVAASVDGEVVRLYVDGQLDAQYANSSTVRASTAPLVIGNAFDPRHLTSFGGDLRIDPSANVKLFYPFDGAIDEVRLTRGARSHFESITQH